MRGETILYRRCLGRHAGSARLRFLLTQPKRFKIRLRLHRIFFQRLGCRFHLFTIGYSFRQTIRQIGRDLFIAYERILGSLELLFCLCGSDFLLTQLL